MPAGVKNVVICLIFLYIFALFVMVLLYYMFCLMRGVVFCFLFSSFFQLFLLIGFGRLLSFSFDNMVYASQLYFVSCSFCFFVLRFLLLNKEKAESNNIERQQYLK